MLLIFLSSLYCYHFSKGCSWICQTEPPIAQVLLVGQSMVTSTHLSPPVPSLYMTKTYQAFLMYLKNTLQRNLGGVNGKNIKFG